uniref:Uncharacterized protein n=1 Tax=Picea sitchensis TaxID=3332 RepID=A0A6B9XXK3_PICSI|nr:hypothetical protein Q903MT_gene4340 [Picea sitchensis]
MSEGFEICPTQTQYIWKRVVSYGRCIGSPIKARTYICAILCENVEMQCRTGSDRVGMAIV